MCRLVAKHVKLVFKLAFWFVAAGVLIFGSLAAAAEGSLNIHVGGGSPALTGGGPESEKFYRTMNKATAPLRWVVDGLVSVLGALSLVAVILMFGNNPTNCAGCETSFLDRGILGEYRAHLLVGNLILLAIYLLWLWVTAVDLVGDEFGPSYRHGDAVPRDSGREGRYVVKTIGGIEDVWFEFDRYGDRERLRYVFAALAMWTVGVAAAVWGIRWLLAVIWS